MRGSKPLFTVLGALFAFAGTACGDGADAGAREPKPIPDAGPPAVVVQQEPRAQRAVEVATDAVDESVEAVSSGVSEVIGTARDGIDTTVDTARARSADVERAARRAEAEATAAAARAVEDVASRAGDGDLRATGRP